MKELRDLHDMTQEDLAGIAEIDRSYVSFVEHRKYAASVDMIEKIAAAFQVSIDELLKPGIAETVRKRLGK
ncbi:helix-turn-helix transcriptional regulator [Sphingopyxis sp.]|uniref:helix-turn-helix transcriptional regulator n=1 Tax=Sphingopyxis sp. TaxID=1908224 RepID=UPI0026382C2F|nr:helix-turn-helix transcriptional regulator [Sphingopyxis sp.]MCW0199894.1 helix-turn-helix transcriptional regulator [Sphingopyxis sp.]